MDTGIIFGDFIVQVIFPILGAALMVLLGLAAQKLNQKFKTEIFTRNIHIIEDLAGKAAAYAEEKATVWARERGKITGQEKADIAIAWLMQRSPELTREQAQQWIEAILSDYGYGAQQE